MNNNDFSYYLSRFLTTYLHSERNVSQNTIISYANTFKLLLIYYQDKLNIRSDRITMNDITKDNIISYLDWLENKRGLSISSRNVRLAAIHSFIRYVQIEDPTHLHEYKKILAIKNKKQHSPEIPYLSINQIKLIINTPDITTELGLRDKVLLTTLYDTGARVEEIINLKYSDIRLDNPATVRLIGKGNKARTVPIMGNTKTLLQGYLDNIKKRPSIDYLFTNRSHKKLTRAGIKYLINKYVDLVNLKETVITINVHPHTFRHSKAVHLLESGIELIYIRDFLGHSSVKTTEIYAKVCSKNKRDALESAYEEITDNNYSDWNDDKDLMNWLNDICLSK